MSSTQKDLPGKAGKPTTITTTTTLTVPGTDTTIQVTGTKVTIPASFGRHHRQPKSGNNTTTTKTDDVPSAAKPNTTTSGTCPHYKWQPSPTPSQTQTRYVPDCAKPRKGLVPTPAPKWCPVCCSGPMPPWAEAPKPTSKAKRKEGEKKKEVDEDEEAYDGRREDDWTDVWFDMD
ncbi:hypothetical protein NEUTE1DRAFT_41467 [Neurospora tetrasperma FGSC 2508]|uniref:Uncharacterized protein n=1 Tax=Neurospora tetrasperma (strain FGSC 2508 / ATCC MYA-4615 / P0657) TaxID=510951 RepID=F8MJR0_NEUT8|nr:uncharacterized protein NEUTE1DRAFT_41467 [Neurospora tetrasperma FGSC 2508]EGO57301.1 hypothetical protein NEUTE1DRAFT_41467 [Neurospora tetrasperma FGSC 2508]EGZ72448.1 hypothetical protein NEUTE2DRAFT_129806 [Neurospora tetrasperma FGSC 2509]